MLKPEQQIINLLTTSQNILITFNRSWNGDTVPSALALFLFLKNLEKNVDIIVDLSNQSQNFSFLPGYSEIKSSDESWRSFIITLSLDNALISKLNYKIIDDKVNFYITTKNGNCSAKDISSSYSDYKYDVAVVLNTPDLESLGSVYTGNIDFFFKTPIINIDCHPNNESFGQINFVDLTAVSTCETLHTIIQSQENNKINKEIATCLLAGMISETRSFKTSNITPKSLSVASQLMSYGAKLDEIVNKLYKSRNINILKLWGRVLAGLSSNTAGNLVWSSLKLSDFVETQANPIDLNEVVAELIMNTPEAKVVFIFYEIEENGEVVCEVLAYSARNIDLLKLIDRFGPVGDSNLARFKTKTTIEVTKQDLLSHVEARLPSLLY